MTEVELRQKVVTEALEWVGTPYISNAMVKGRRGGTDCAMILLGVYGNVGLIPKEFDPRPYPPDWHVHRSEERYINTVLQWADEVKAPPERMPLAGDLVMFKIGHVFAHAAIILDWPMIVHAVGGSVVCRDDVSRHTTGKRALWNIPKTFYTLRSWSIG